MDSGDGGTLPAYIRHLMAKVSKNKETKNIVELASLAPLNCRGGSSSLMVNASQKDFVPSARISDDDNTRLSHSAVRLLLLLLSVVTGGVV